jgi:uncharacterized membrane protein YoaK (UPF0700 family)
MSRKSVREAWRGAPLAFALAGVGGYVDGVGFLALFQVFTSHMSGNTTMTGVRLGQQAWADAGRAAFPIPVFFCGVVTGALLTDSLRRRGVRLALAFVLGLEAGLLFLCTLWGDWALATGAVSGHFGVEYYALVALLTLAMGMQNAALRRAHGGATRTTFITGTLTTAGEEAAAFLSWLHDRAKRRRSTVLLRLGLRQTSWNRMAVLMTLWSAYLGGASAGAAAEQNWGMVCLAAPVAGILGLIGYEFVRPRES